MRKKPTGRRTATYSIDLELQDRLKMASFDMSRMEGRHVSMSEIVENALKKHLDYFESGKRFVWNEGDITIIKPKKTAKIESKPLEGVKSKATTPKPKKQGKDSQSYQIFEAVFAGYGKDSKGNAVVLFQSIQSSEPGLVHEASSKHKQAGKAIKEFLATNPKQGDKIRFEAFIESGKIAQPRKIEIL